MGAVSIPTTGDMSNHHAIESLADYLGRPFRLDLRSIAVFRVGLGFLLLVDLVNRSFAFRAHYTDFGVLPRQVLLGTEWDPNWVSVHLFNGSFWPTAALFVVSGAAAVALLIGYRTTLAAVLSWCLLVSLQARNPLVLQGGDVLLRLLAFWAMFLPLGARWSIDAALDPDGEPTAPDDQTVCSAATVAYVCQIALVYLFSALLKGSPEWWRDFSAVYYALSIDQFTTPLGDWLWHQSETLLQVLTAVTFGLEAFGWALLFAPLLTLPFFERSNRWFRGVAIVLFVSMHLSIAAAMRLGLFSYIVSVAWIALVPTGFWEWSASRCETVGAGWTIRVEQPSDEGVGATVARLLRGLLVLPAAAIEVEVTDGDETRWEVESAGGDRWAGPSGFVALVEASPLLGPLYRLLGRLAPVREALRGLWKRVRDRSWLRRPLARCHPRRYRRRQTILGGIFVVLALAGAVWWNLQTVRYKFTVTEPWRSLVVYARLDQRWNMFASHPLKNDGWYVMPGRLRDGERVSLFQAPTREPPSWTKPGDVSATYAGQRWRKYFMNLVQSDFSEHWAHYARYRCRRWNSIHEDEDALLRMKVYFMEETSQPDHEVPEPTKRHLWTHRCFEDVGSGSDEELDANDNIRDLPALPSGARFGDSDGE